MDIRIIPSKKDESYYYLNKDVVLIIKKQPGSPSGFASQLPFPKVSYYLYNVNNDVKEELLPEFDKYMAASFFTGEKQSNEIFFFHIEYSAFPNATFYIFSYDYKHQLCKEVYRFEDNLKLYESDKKIDLFILNSNYFILQFRNIKSKGNSKVKQYVRFESFLYDRSNRMIFEINDNRIKTSGIYQMLPVSNNVCAVRLGYNLIDDNRYKSMTKSDAVTETIGLFSISQLISDILLKLPTFSMEVVDEVFWNKTFSSIKVCGKYVIFSRISMENKSQEIFFYQYVSKETLMLLNKNPYSPESLMACVLQKNPYIVKERRKYIEFYNINRNNVEVKLPSGTKILDIQNDILFLASKKKGLFAKDKDEQLEICQFEGMKILHREKLSDIKVINVSPERIIVFLQDKEEK